MSSTPRFTSALERLFSDIHAGTRTCPETGMTFELTATALERYRAHQVPPSKIAPWARIQRMRAYASGFDFFQRTLPSGQTVITVYDPQSPVTLLPTKEWYVARLNGDFLSYGRSYDPRQSFFAQWKVFSQAVPRPALVTSALNENSEWTCFCNDVKNEYYGYSEAGSHDMLYSEHSWMGAHCCDVTAADKSQWQYETVLGGESSQVFWSEHCVGSFNLFFCRSCTSCSDCFGCTNLRQKKYCFLNKQLSEEEYKKQMQNIDLNDATVVEYWKERVKREALDPSPKRASGNRQCEQCDGDDMVNCKETVGTSVADCERCENVYFNAVIKDCADCTMSTESEWSVYSQELIRAYQNRFSTYAANCIDIEYCELMQSCEHCFGCIGLEKKKYCIFNQQYSEQEYWQRVDELKTTMLARGEYGEFFPYDGFLTAYNTSHAQNLYPLTSQEAQKRGARWYDFKEESGAAMEPIEALPTNLAQTTDEVLTKVYRCPVSGRPFRIVKAELEFHRRFGIALPRLHPTVRRKARMGRMFPLHYRAVSCVRCGVVTKTRIPPEEKAVLFCETCYNAYVFEDEALTSTS